MADKTANQSGAGRAFRYVRHTVLGGFLFLVPVLIVVFVLVKAGPFLRRLAKPFDSLVPGEGIFGVLVADLLAILILLAVCFLAGLLARLSLADRFVKRAESGLLWRIPGYDFLKAMLESVDAKGTPSLRPVLIHFDDSSQLALEVERLADGRSVVYVPSAPQPRAGSVIVMDANRVEPVPMTFMAALRSMRALGKGVGPWLSPPAK